MRRTTMLWACLTLAAAACGGGATNQPDTGDVPHEVGETGDGDDGGDGAGRAKQTVMTSTSGGGRAAGGSYVLQLNIGTPQPMGSGANGSHRLGVGPGAVQNQ